MDLIDPFYNHILILLINFLIKIKLCDNILLEAHEWKPDNGNNKF